jgi:hypothetical protein
MVVRLGEGPVSLTDGGSYFDEQERPRRRSTISYAGMRLHRLEVPLMFDGWISGASVEAPLIRLEALAVSRQGVKSEPSPIRIDGAGIPRKTLEWFIESLDFGTDVIVSGGNRVRQDVRMRLVQKVDVALSMAEADRRPKSKITYRKVRVERKTSLRRLAATVLGSSSRWKEIRDSRGRNFRTDTVKAGTTLRIPRS